MISMIVAVAENNVIGKDNQLIWHLPADIKFFKEKTTGHCVITGRKNYESIPEKFRPLPNRTNIIITRQKDYKAPGAIVVGSVSEALNEAKKQGDAEIFIIGGADIFRQTMDITDRIYYTRIFHRFEGDTFFPDPDPAKWMLTKKSDCEPDEKNKYRYSFMEYERIK
jgi:dihydrofolate reductase